MQQQRSITKQEKAIAAEKHLYELKLIEEYTGKPANEVLNTYSIPELIRLSAYLDFLKFI